MNGIVTTEAISSELIRKEVAKGRFPVLYLNGKKALIAEEAGMEEKMENQENEWWAGYSGDPFANTSYGLCEKCKRRTIDRSEDPKSVLCRECREELIKQKKRKAVCIAGTLALIVILIGGVSFWVLSKKSKLEDTQDIQAVQDSPDLEENPDMENSLSEEGYILTEMNELLSVLEEDPEDISTAFRLTDLAMEYAYYDYAAYAINQYIAEKDISDKQYRRLNRYVDKLNVYYDTCDLNDEIINQIYEDIGEDGDPYEIMDEYCRGIAEYIGNSAYDQALLYYCLGSMTADEETRINYLKECIAINPYYFNAQAQIATYCRRQGDLEQARQVLEEVYAVNKEDYAVLRSYATLELVEGNLEKGLDYASKAYEMYEEGDYVIDTYIVALAANGRVDEAKELAKEYEDEDYPFDEDFYDFLDGKMTLEDYYIGE